MGLQYVACDGNVLLMEICWGLWTLGFIFLNVYVYLIKDVEHIKRPLIVVTLIYQNLTKTFICLWLSSVVVVCTFVLAIVLWILFHGCNNVVFFLFSTLL